MRLKTPPYSTVAAFLFAECRLVEQVTESQRHCHVVVEPFRLRLKVMRTETCGEARLCFAEVSN